MFSYDISPFFAVFSLPVSAAAEFEPSNLESRDDDSTTALLPLASKAKIWFTRMKTFPEINNKVIEENDKDKYLNG
jgi:hypothetical protein